VADWILLCAIVAGLVYIFSGWAGNRQFGLFKKKSPTVMDGPIRTIYGANPLPKSADLERSITIAHEDLLFERVPLSEVKQRASELFKGSIPYSTHDLAVSTALAFFKNPEYVPALRECQIPARMRVRNWAIDGKVVKPLAASFEEVLYRLYKPQLPEAGERPMANEEADRKTQKSPSPKPTVMEPDARQLPKGSTDGLGGPPQMADYYSVITRAISALP
jgi:hypothetical protein